MNKLKITSRTQQVFALWVKRRYDIGRYNISSLKPGEYEALQSIVDDGTYNVDAVKVLNTLRRNLANEFKEYVKQSRYEQTNG
jgi:hypothetical protein